jgi:hypothetical protein
LWPPGQGQSGRQHQGAETQDVHEHWAQDGKGKWNKAIHEQKQSANELPKKITTV